MPNQVDVPDPSSFASYETMSRFKNVLRARLGNFVPSERRYLMGRDWKKSSDKGFEVRE